MSWSFKDFAAHALVLCIIFYGANANLTLLEAYPNLLDPHGNITIVWDIISTTSYSYTAVVSIYNFQKCREIQSPGWTLGWTWAGNEVIWGFKGAQVTSEGNCSKFSGNTPHCCEKHPKIVDLPTKSDNQPLPNCCKGGILSSWLSSSPQDATSSFEIVVGAGSKGADPMAFANISLHAQEGNYVCKGPYGLKISHDDDLSRRTFKKWHFVCGYEAAQTKIPGSLSSFNIETILPCPTSSCSCKNNGSAIPTLINWHMKSIQKKYWHGDVSIFCFDKGFSYSAWNLLVQRPDFSNATHIIASNPMFLSSVTPNSIFLWDMSVYELEMHIPSANRVSVSEVSFYFIVDKCRMLPVKGMVLLLRYHHLPYDGHE